MSQQLLHRTNIGTTIHQVSRRRMTQNVRTRRLSILHRAQQAGQVLTNLTGVRTPAPRANKQRRHALGPLLDPLRTTIGHPTIQRLKRRGAQRHHALLIALTQHAHRLIRPVHALQIQAGQLRNTHARSVQNLNHSFQAQQARITRILRPTLLQGSQQLVHLLTAQHRRQVILPLGSAHTAGRVSVHQLLLLSPGEERAQGRTAARHRRTSRLPQMQRTQPLTNQGRINAVQMPHAAARHVAEEALQIGDIRADRLFGTVLLIAQKTLKTVQDGAEHLTGNTQCRIGQSRAG